MSKKAKLKTLFVFNRTTFKKKNERHYLYSIGQCQKRKMKKLFLFNQTMSEKAK